MSLTQWIRGLRHSGYDRHGDAKYLLGRPADPLRCDVPGVPEAIRDEALSMLCDAFDIPERQRYCLRPSDDLMAIYRSFVGPRFWDDLEFERLGMALDKLPGGNVEVEEFRSIETVGDLMRFVARRRGITIRQTGPTPPS